MCVCLCTCPCQCLSLCLSELLCVYLAIGVSVSVYLSYCTCVSTFWCQCVSFCLSICGKCFVSLTLSSSGTHSQFVFVLSVSKSLHFCLLRASLFLCRSKSTLSHLAPKCSLFVCSFFSVLPGPESLCSSLSRRGIPLVSTNVIRKPLHCPFISFEGEREKKG